MKRKQNPSSHHDDSGTDESDDHEPIGEVSKTYQKKKKTRSSSSKSIQVKNGTIEVTKKFDAVSEQKLLDPQTPYQH